MVGQRCGHEWHIILVVNDEWSRRCVIPYGNAKLIEHYVEAYAEYHGARAGGVFE